MSDPKSKTGNTGESVSVDRKLALFQAVFDEIPDVVVLKDAKGNFLLCNQTVARLYNTTPEAMVGKQDGDFGVPQATADVFRENVLGIMARGQTEVVFEDSHDAVSGEIRHFKSTKRPFKDAEGRDQILVIAQDITDVVRAQQQVVQSERQLQDVMAATQEGIWDWQVDTGRVVHNERWFGILGFSDGEIADNVEAFSAHIHPDDKADVWARIQQLMDGSTAVYQSEHRMLCKDGAVVWVQDRGRVAERDAQGRPVRVVGAFADITQRKNDQVALEQALDLAQSATRAKSEFLATMSHELRTPMNGILGMAQLLQMPDLSDQERSDYAQTILSSGRSLLALLNDILDLSKVEAGRLELDRRAFNLRQLLLETTAVFEELAQAKGLRLDIQYHALSSYTYWGDPLRLRQMLSNYLGNAIKFTARGGVRLDVRELLDSQQQPVLEFSVSDSGIGIPADKQGLLFKPFTQADSSTTREFGGTGLGLSIVARLAELMGGQVGLESRDASGSRFWFRIQAQPSPSGAPSPVRAGFARRDAAIADAFIGRLLVAEDNPVNRMVIGTLLRKLGLQPEFVEDGQAALDAVVQGPRFDLILMDVQMPVMDGQQATRRIRQWEAQTGAPRCTIVALTAGAFEDDRLRCSEAGMDDFMTKPIDVKSLSQTLTRWLTGHTAPADQNAV